MIKTTTTSSTLQEICKQMEGLRKRALIIENKIKTNLYEDALSRLKNFEWELTISKKMISVLQKEFMKELGGLVIEPPSAIELPANKKFRHNIKGFFFLKT